MGSTNRMPLTQPTAGWQLRCRPDRRSGCASPGGYDSSFGKVRRKLQLPPQWQPPGRHATAEGIIAFRGPQAFAPSREGRSGHRAQARAGSQAGGFRIINLRDSDGRAARADPPGAARVGAGACGGGSIGPGTADDLGGPQVRKRHRACVHARDSHSDLGRSGGGRAIFSDKQPDVPV